MKSIIRFNKIEVLALEYFSPLNARLTNSPVYVGISVRLDSI